MPAAAGLAAGARAQAPLWRRDCELIERRPLAQDARCEVCVVGAGVTGLTTAYLLARSGRQVRVVDEGLIGAGQSARGGGQLATAAAHRYCALERMHGEASAAQVAASQARALDLIESIIRAEDIACDFRRLAGYLFCSDAGQSGQLLRDECQAAQRAGMREVEMLGRAPDSACSVGTCLRFGGQGELHPLKYLLGLAQAAERCGAQLHTRTRASAIGGGAQARLQLGGGAHIDARYVIFASDNPPDALHASQLRQAAYASYMIAARLPRNGMQSALYWDTCDPYHHARLYRDGESDLLLVGGGDHRARLRVDPQLRFAGLERWAYAHFPQIKSVDYRWAGQVVETVDGLPYIGAVPGAAPNVLLACGGGRMGFIYGTVAALLFCEQITGCASPWAPVYSPDRCNTRHHLVRLLGAETGAQAATGAPLSARQARAEARHVQREARTLRLS